MVCLSYHKVGDFQAQVLVEQKNGKSLNKENEQGNSILTE